MCIFLCRWRKKCSSALSRDNRERTRTLINKITYTHECSLSNVWACTHTTTTHTVTLLVLPINLQVVTLLFCCCFIFSLQLHPFLHFTLLFTYLYLPFLLFSHLPPFLEYDVDTSIWTEMIAIYSEHCVYWNWIYFELIFFDTLNLLCLGWACQFLSRVETPTLWSKPSLVGLSSSVSHHRAADSNYVMEKMDGIRSVHMCVWSCMRNTQMFTCVCVCA